MFRLLYNLIITIFRFIARFNEAIRFFMVNYMNFIIIIVIKLVLIIFIIINTITIIINIKIIIFLINFNYLNVKANQKYFFHF